MNEVIDDKAQSRFELRIEEGTAIAVYEQRGDLLAFVHTEVPEGERGQGLGDRLIAGALEKVRQRGEKIIPACEFVRSYVERHPDAQDLVADDA